MKRRDCTAIVMGVSAGGLAALTTILPNLSNHLGLPILIVQHLSPDSDDFLATHFNKICSLTVKEAEDKEAILNNTIYFAPANYHLMVEQDKTIALSTAERVQFSRPAIDVLFETAAEAYMDGLMGILLTGANSDGTRGCPADQATQRVCNCPIPGNSRGGDHALICHKPGRGG